MKKYILFRHIILIVFIFLLGIFLIGCSKKDITTKNTKKKEVVIQEKKEEGDFELVKIDNKWYIGGLVDKEKEEIIIPSTLDVCGIWEKAFCYKPIFYGPASYTVKDYYNDTLKKVTIEKEFKEINNYAFYECRALTEITLPKTIQRIDDYAFYKCESLNEIILPKATKEIGNYSFCLCSHLNKIDFSNIKNIGKRAFHVTMIKDLNFTSNIKTIGDGAFLRCNVEQVMIPSSIKRIGEGCFGDCSLLKEVDLSKCNKITMLNAFDSCVELKTILLPKRLKILGDGAFINCKSLKEINLPNSLTEIGVNAFANTGLKNIIIPKNVTIIGEYCFSYNASLDKIVILGKIKKMGSNSFGGYYGNPELKIYYKWSLQDWDKIEFYYLKELAPGVEEIIDSKHELMNEIDKLYYSEKKPTDTSIKYWHFVDGEAVPWGE